MSAAVHAASTPYIRTNFTRGTGTLKGPKVTVVRHPMVLEQLTLARNKTTNQIAFRKAIFRLGRLMAHEFLRTLETQEFPVETPFGKTTGYKVKGNDKIEIILILRASIPFVDGMYKELPMARTGIISAWRGRRPPSKSKSTTRRSPTSIRTTS